MTESDKKLLLAKLREKQRKYSDGITGDWELAMREAIEIVDAIETEPSLEELLESLPTKRGWEFLQYGTSVPNGSPKFYCWYSGEEWETFTTHSCIWSDVSLKDAVQKLKALIDKR